MRLAALQFEAKLQKYVRMGINIFKNFNLGRYIVGYTVGNHVLWLRLRVAVKQNFRPYIRLYTSPNENFEYIYPLNDFIFSYFLLLLHLFKFGVICVRFSSAFITLGKRASCVLCRGNSWSYSRFVLHENLFAMFSYPYLSYQHQQL